jgi:signal transduction histidine kinase
MGNRTSVPAADASRFPLLVALACHDLRTPLATVHGFARTLARLDLPEPQARYVEMIDAASEQLAELLDELSLVTRIELGRFEPRVETVDSLELAREAAAELEHGVARVSGEGTDVGVERDAARRAIRQLARAARRHGGLESVDVVVRGAELAISPLGGTAPGVVTGKDLRELGAAAAVTFLWALGGSVALDGDELVVGLPAAP